MNPSSRTVSDSSGEMWVITGFSSERVPSTNIPLVESSPVIHLVELSPVKPLVSTERTIHHNQVIFHEVPKGDVWCGVYNLHNNTIVCKGITYHAKQSGKYPLNNFCSEHYKHCRPDRGYTVNAWGECWFKVNGVLSAVPNP